MKKSILLLLFTVLLFSCDRDKEPTFEKSVWVYKASDDVMIQAAFNILINSDLVDDNIREMIGDFDISAFSISIEFVDENRFNSLIILEDQLKIPFKNRRYHLDKASGKITIYPITLDEEGNNYDKNTSFEGRIVGNRMIFDIPYEYTPEGGETITIPLMIVFIKE